MLPTIFDDRTSFQDRLATAFERLASAAEESLKVSQSALAVQQQMALTSKTLETALAAGTASAFKRNS